MQNNHSRIDSSHSYRKPLCSYKDAENHNAYNDPKYAPVIKQMKKDMLNLRKEVGDTDEKYPEMQELLEKYYYK